MRILIGLGGNLGGVRENFIGALSALNEFGFIDLQRVSSLYLTAPIGPDQPDYLNAAAVLRVSCDPRRLLKICQDQERSFGRNREAEERWGPRTLDLDLLLARNLICVGSNLNLPHPRLVERAFVVIPSAEIVPDWKHPFEKSSFEELSRREGLLGRRIERIEDAEWAKFMTRVEMRQVPVGGEVGCLQP